MSNRLLSIPSLFLLVAVVDVRESATVVVVVVALVVVDTGRKLNPVELADAMLCAGVGLVTVTILSDEVGLTTVVNNCDVSGDLVILGGILIVIPCGLHIGVP